MRAPLTRRVALLLATLALAFGVPLGIALASHQFSDVPASNPFHGDISALVDAGVTSGCGGGKYCPAAYVTREQMAAFLNRLGALAANKTPVVNAKTAQNADKLDGFDAATMVRTSYAVTDNAAGDGAGGVLLSAPITAPTRGWYSVVASVNVRGDGTANDLTCALYVDDDWLTGSIRAIELNGFTSDQTCATNAGAMTCGGSQTVTLRAFSVAAGTQFLGGSLQVVFTPFSGSGLQPKAIDCVSF